ncbi:MAG: ethanolamine utilization protein EutM [Rhodothermales bacterium]
MMDQGALGLIETKGLVAAIEAADAAVKAASVRLLGIQKTNPALITIQVVGETAAVRAAIDAAKAAAGRVGTVVSTHVIPRPAIDVVKMQSLEDSAIAAKAPPVPSGPAKSAAPLSQLPKAPKIAMPKTLRKPARRASTLAAAPVKETGRLDSMTVRELRALARSTEGLSLQGREIARASKSELLQALGR